MHGCCNSHALTANAKYRIDPTKTLTLRKRYEADMVRRFRELSRAIRDGVGEADVFGLRTNDVKPPPQFEFLRDPDKVPAFLEWLRESHKRGILEIRRGTRLISSGDHRWQDIYLQSAYQKGIASAAGDMRKAGADVAPSYIDAAFNRPVHADRAGLIYSRAYSDLEGITAAMDTAMSRILAQGIIDGRSPRVLARQLSEAVEGIGIRRARTLARTEVIRAHADAQLASFAEAGIEQVKVLAEFATAGDNKVCPKCQDLETRDQGNGPGIYTQEQASGVIPVHPNCRCTWRPVVQDLRGVTLR